MYETRLGEAECPWCMLERIKKETVTEVLDIINGHASDLYDLAERKWRLVSENDPQIHAKITTCESLAAKIRQSFT